jgi:uncharacterized integral membrane protein
MIMTILRWLFTILITALVIVFAYLNRDSVSLNIGPSLGTLSMPLFIPLMTCLIAGAIIGGLISLIGHMKLKGKARQLEKLLRESEAALTAARTEIMQLEDDLNQARQCQIAELSASSPNSPIVEARPSRFRMLRRQASWQKHKPQP